MRKVHFTLMFLIVTFVSAIAAKKGTIMLQTPSYHEVSAISPNGKWACGIFNDYQIHKAFLWDLKSNKVIYFNDGMSEAWGVSDDGTICGLFTTTDFAENGAPVATGGYWKDGKLTLLKDESGKLVLSEGSAITPDGQYIAGVIKKGVTWSPCIWKNGVLERRLNTNGQSGYVTALSDDGQIAVGWFADGNRRACYWTPELTRLTDSKGFTNVANSISPNKKYILATDNDGKYIYDRVENKYHRIDYLTDPENDGSIQIMDDGTSIVWEGFDLFSGSGIIYKLDGTWKTAEDWLKDNWGVEIPKTIMGGPSVSRFSRDMKTFVGLCYTGADDYAQALYCGTAWITDQEVELAKPNNLSCEQLFGSSNMMLKWKEPFANSKAVTLYRVYRDGKKLADVPNDNLCFVDKTVGGKNLTYQVSAIYGTEESEKEELAVTLKDLRYTAAPNNFSAYQSNYNSVILNWAAPNTGYDATVRLHEDDFCLPFGSEDARTIWAGVEFDNNLIGAYADNFVLSAVDFYPYETANSMKLCIYVDDEEVLTQDIDQSKLVLGCNNVIRLNKPMELNAGMKLKVAIQIEQIQTGRPIGMSKAASVPGGDMCSIDGVSWVSLKEMTYGAYNHNWMIGLLLDSNGNDDGALSPSTRATDKTIVTGYVLYRDGEKIHEIKLEENPQAVLRYADANVTGKHKYEIEAIFNQMLVSPRKAITVKVKERKLDECLAPVNLKGENKEDGLLLTWDMPEISKVSYSNWTTQIGMSLVNTGEYYCGSLYEAEMMRPYAGFEITKVNFWPLEDVTYEIHIYEGQEDIYSQAVTQYTKNRLNTLVLTDPVTIKPYKDYMIVVKVSNVPNGGRPMGIDTGHPYTYGCMISEDGFSYRPAPLDIPGNFMIGIDVERVIEGFNPGLSYKVYVDGSEQATVTDSKYTKPFGNITQPTSLKVSVAAVYPVGEKKSGEVTVVIDPSRINENEISVVKVYPNPAKSFIQIEGNVSEVRLFNIAGQEVFNSEGVRTLDVTGFVPGMYMLKTIVDGKSYTNKVQIIK